MSLLDVKNLVVNNIKYSKYDSEGKALGCMAPVYAMYPNGPRFEHPEDKNLKEYVLKLLNSNCDKKELKDIEVGDIVALNMPFGFFHVAIYIGDDYIIHCSEISGSEKVRLSPLQHRVEGVWKWA
jgi:cell wall-associated NlpC family hydrolase